MVPKSKAPIANAAIQDVALDGKGVDQIESIVRKTIPKFGAVLDINYSVELSTMKPINGESRLALASRISAIDPWQAILPKRRNRALRTTGTFYLQPTFQSRP